MRTDERAPDAAYRHSRGTKIFITYGDHDMNDNIAHFVLARLPDAPARTKGILALLITKFLVNADGSMGARQTTFIPLALSTSSACMLRRT